MTITQTGLGHCRRYARFAERSLYLPRAKERARRLLHGCLRWLRMSQ